jgi:glycine betaine/proline transport system ATP-binding protein
MPADRTVREAAKEAMASQHPVRVVDGDHLVGIVDDDDLLRIIVAEEVPSP